MSGGQAQTSDARQPQPPRHVTNWLFGAAPRRAIAETLAVFAGLATLFALALAWDARPTLRAGLLLLFTLTTTYLTLRLRLPGGGWWARLRQEGLALIGLGVALELAALLALFGIPSLRQTLSEDLLLATIFTALCLLGATTLRTGGWVWRFWAQQRRTRVLWNLIHYQLTLVGMVGLLVTVLLLVIFVNQSLNFAAPDASRSAQLVDVLLIIFSLGGASLFLIAIGLLVMFPPAFLISFLFARRVTRRLEQLTQASSALRTGAYDARIVVDGEDEIAQLQTDFNAMASDLERAMRELQTERDAVAALLLQRRELVASVSHELRTPVATLRGYLESALSRPVGAPPATWRTDLVVMERETVRLQRLIDDLFTLSRAEVGGLALSLQPTDVAAAAQASVTALAPLAWQQGRVDVIADLPGDLPPALVDAGRLDQILSNLLRNGVRHTPPGGIVAVSALSTPEWVILQVRDTGEGIAPEDAPHIFERFFRAERARSRDAGGAGLGLALVKELTESMGGSVAVESAPGEGSCFTVHLPRACPSHATLTPDPRASLPAP